MSKLYSGAEIVFKCLEDQDVEFIFGFSKNFNSKVLIEGLHKVFNEASFLNNKKYS